MVCTPPTKAKKWMISNNNEDEQDQSEDGDSTDHEE